MNANEKSFKKDKLSIEIDGIKLKIYCPENKPAIIKPETKGKRIFLKKILIWYAEIQTTKKLPNNKSESRETRFKNSNILH